MRRAPFSAAVACVVVACVHPQADRGGEIPGADQGPSRPVRVDQVPVKGFHVTAIARAGGTDVEGELLAADGKSLWIAPIAGPAVVKVAAAHLRAVKTEPYEDNTPALGAWTLAGASSTISHGCLLVCTLPAWLVVGGATTGASAAANDIEIEPDRADLLRQYARYPQGMPVAPTAPTSTPTPSPPPPPTTTPSTPPPPTSA